MKVAISVSGRFHAFELARQLIQRGYLECLITSYPVFEVKKYGIPPEKVHSILLTEVLSRAWRKLPQAVRVRYNPQFLFSEMYDRRAAMRVPAADICVAWAGFGLETIRRAGELGAAAVIERGSSHILHQSEILKEEYEKYGLVYKGCLLYTSPSPRDLSTSRMPSSA